MGENLKLKSIRVLHDDSQLDVAKILGINKNSYCMKENGSRNFTLREAEIMSVHYKLSPEQTVDIFFTGNVHTKGTKRKK